MPSSERLHDVRIMWLSGINMKRTEQNSQAIATDGKYFEIVAMATSRAAATKKKKKKPSLLQWSCDRRSFFFLSLPNAYRWWERQKTRPTTFQVFIPAIFHVTLIDIVVYDNLHWHRHRYTKKLICYSLLSWWLSIKKICDAMQKQKMQIQRRWREIISNKVIKLFGAISDDEEKVISRGMYFFFLLSLKITM